MKACRDWTLIRGSHARRRKDAHVAEMPAEGCSEAIQCLVIHILHPRACPCYRVLINRGLLATALWTSDMSRAWPLLRRSRTRRHSRNLRDVFSNSDRQISALKLRALATNICTSVKTRRDQSPRLHPAQWHVKRPKSRSANEDDRVKHPLHDLALRRLKAALEAFSAVPSRGRSPFPPGCPVPHAPGGRQSPFVANEWALSGASCAMRLGTNVALFTPAELWVSVPSHGCNPRILCRRKQHTLSI